MESSFDKMVLWWREQSNAVHSHDGLHRLSNCAVLLQGHRRKVE